MTDVLKHRLVLISRWHLGCDVEPAWRRISQVRDWPAWWPQVAAVCVEDTDHGLAGNVGPRMGSRASIRWKTPLGYGLQLRVTTTHVAAPFELEGVAEGDLEGHGLWLLEPHAADRVLITYRWDVRLNRRWMRLASPLLRPVFAYNHASVMRAGARGIAKAIGCRLLRHEDCSISPGVPSQDSHTPARMA